MLLILFILYLYYIFARVKLSKGISKNLVFIIVVSFLFGLSNLLGWSTLGIAAILVASLLFIYFYTDALFREQCYPIFLPGGWLAISSIGLQVGFLDGNIAVIGMTLLLFILLSKHRGYLHKANALIVIIVNLVLIILDIVIVKYGQDLFRKTEYIYWSRGVLLFVTLMLFCLLELTLSRYEKGFLTTTKELRECMLSQQYEEIQAVYLNMRGWRHDYHNHIQVLKANLDQDRIENARAYLDDIEEELCNVDTFIKSGNVMADAILNSKLTLAQQKKIAITCDAFLPNELFVNDIDLCTILGNVLDNAIESCEKLSEQERFIRVYLALQKEQLYISIQNASVQEINFEQKNYISTKRGNHGLGMKRVAAVVNKWEGYFHLSQEPGVFATEIMIPCTIKE